MRLVALSMLCISIASKISVASDDAFSDIVFKENPLPSDSPRFESTKRIPDIPFFADQDQDPNGSSLMLDGSHILSDAAGAIDGCSPSQLRRPGSIRARQQSACYPYSPSRGSNVGGTGASDSKKKPSIVTPSVAPVGDPDSIDVKNSPVTNYILKDICPDKFGDFNIPACSSGQPEDTVCVGGVCVLDNCERSMSPGIYGPDRSGIHMTYNYE